MDRPESPTLPREPLAATFLRAALIAAAAGAAIGALEALPTVLRGVRTLDWGARFVLVAILGDALLALGLSIPAAATAALLQGRPTFRAAPASACAGLGAALGAAAFVASGSIGTTLVVPAAVGGTLLALALRELLAWWSWPARPGFWIGLAGLGGAAGVIALAVRNAEGGERWVGAGLGALGILCVASARRTGAGGLSAGLACPLAALVLLTGSSPPGPDEPGASDAVRVVWISIDTLRADHVGCYGYGRADTPAIDALAREGVLFEDATSQANTTGPSHTTMLTGLYPAEHGALSNGRPIAHRARTLPELLGERGYHTAGFVSGFTLVDAACGLASRFHAYDDNLLAWRWLPPFADRLRVVQSAIRLAGRRGVRVQRSDRPAGETVAAALEWLDGVPETEPYFLFLHCYDPHAPYEPPAPFHPGPAPEGFEEEDWYDLSTDERRALVDDEAARRHMTSLYDAEIAYADSEVGRLLDALRARADFDRTLVVLTSDHGEGLGAHAYWFDHGTFLYDEELSVPLVVRLPGGERAGTRVRGQVRLLDLFPTIVELAGLEGVAASGASLLPAVRGEAEVGERPSFGLADIAGDMSGFPLDGSRHSLRADGFKLIWSSEHWLDTQRIEARYELYDLAADPEETVDLMRAEPESPELDSLRERLDAWREAVRAADTDEELSEDVLRHLRELGYL